MMRRLRRMRGGQVDEIIDLAAIDVLRDRERGVRRYNDFREALRKRRIERFEDLTEEHRDTNGKVYATTDRTVVVARNLVQHNFHCTKCQYAWYQQEWHDA